MHPERKTKTFVDKQETQKQLSGISKKMKIWEFLSSFEERGLGGGGGYKKHLFCAVHSFWFITKRLILDQIS
jgi:hypothetical protein